MTEEFGLLTVWEFGEEKSYPTYTCGHCNVVVMLRPDRKRPRKRCLSCGKLVCERTKICAEDCTPLRDLVLEVERVFEEADALRG